MSIMYRSMFVLNKRISLNLQILFCTQIETSISFYHLYFQGKQAIHTLM